MCLGTVFATTHVYVLIGPRSAARIAALWNVKFRSYPVFQVKEDYRWIATKSRPTDVPLPIVVVIATIVRTLPVTFLYMFLY